MGDVLKAAALEAASMSPEQLRGLLRGLPLADLNEIDRLLGVPEPETLRQFIARVSPGFRFYRWLDPLLDSLQEIADGTLFRLLVSAPPRHGKSETVSRLFPAYYLNRYPWRWCAVSSYASKLAASFSRAARANYATGIGRPGEEPGGMFHWETGEGGGMWATGVGGGTGFGMSVGVVDDPIRGRQEAGSPIMRQRLMEWYDSVFYTRLEPGGALVVMATRWHQEDLTGQLIAREMPSDDPLADTAASEGWRVIDLPAVAEPMDLRPEYPSTLHVVPDWRKAGEPLCPERFPLERLKRIEHSVGPSVWASLFQQRPRPSDGSMFKYEWFRQLKASHAGPVFRVRYWDLAGSEDGDATAGVRVAYLPGAPIPWIIEHVAHFRALPGRRDALVLATVERDAAEFGATGVIQWLEREAGIGGADRTQAIVAKLAGYIVHTEPASGSKEMRAEPLAAQAEVGNVGIIEADWTHDFLEEILSFGVSEHDDRVDAASGAFNRVTDMARGTWRETEWVPI